MSAAGGPETDRSTESLEPLLRFAADWAPNTDPKHAHFHQPVMRDRALAPAWAQVTGAVAGPAGPVATLSFRSGHPLP